MSAPKSIQETYTLANGIKIPCMGFGTFKSLTASHELTYTTIATAAKKGFRMIDTASLYSNERGVGRGVRESGIAREEFFVMSKVWNQDHGYDKTIAAVEESLSDMGFDYLDMYMIHWPIGPGHDDDWQQVDLETWRALETLYKDGKLRGIGVSNFLPHHLEPLMEKAEIPIMVNELEITVGYHQPETREFCKKNNIQVIAYTPLGGMRYKNPWYPFEPARPEMCSLCEKYGKNEKQIALRWIQQLGVIPIPSSYDPGHMNDNLDIFDFELTEEEIAFIAELPDTKPNHQHPDEVRIDMDRHIRYKI